MKDLVSINGVKGYLDENGTAHLNLEDCARGLGFTQEKNGVMYVRWERVNGHLTQMGFSPLVGKEYIPENVVYRLCMKAENEVAEKFQAKVADEILPAIRKTGAYITNRANPDMLRNKADEIEARLNNSVVRKVRELRKIAEDPTTPKEYRAVLNAKATEMLTGENLLPLPSAERTYTAGEIASELGISATMVGKIANANNLKTEDYGLLVWDKSPYSPKQVQAWRYNENGRSRLVQLFREVQKC